MHQIIVVTLDNKTYHLEEEAFSALRRYLDRARARLQNDPDLNEVLEDFERSIAEKCAGVLQREKTVVSLDEINGILEEIGPVADDGDPESETPSAVESKASAGGARRLYKQPRGAKVSGVCSGLADYFRIDAVFIRIAFIVLSFFGGVGVLAYLVLEMLMPWPSTAERKRNIALWLVLSSLSVVLLYLWANRGPDGMHGGWGVLGLRPGELLLVPIMMGLYLIPVIAGVFVASLVAIASVKYLRSSSRGKD